MRTFSKVLAVVLCLCMLFTTAFASSIIPSHVEFVSGEGNAVTAKVFVKNDGSTDATAKLIIAEYSGNTNTLVGTPQVSTVELKAGAANIAIANYTKTAEANTVKAFIWDTKENTPLHKVSEVLETAPSLSGITANGVELTLSGNSAIAYTDKDGVVPVIKGIPASHTFYTTTAYADDLTSATVTVTNPNTGVSAEYTVAIELYQSPYNPHAVKDHLNDSDFVNDTKADHGLKSSAAVTSAKCARTDGVLYTNFRASTGGSCTDDITDSARYAHDYAANGSQFHEVFVADDSLVGADYFIFTAGGYNFVSNNIGSLMTFQVVKDCEVSIVFNESATLDDPNGEWVAASGNGSTTWFAGNYWNAAPLNLMRNLGITVTPRVANLFKNTAISANLDAETGYYDLTNFIADPAVKDAWEAAADDDANKVSLLKTAGTAIGPSSHNYKYKYTKTITGASEANPVEVTVPAITSSPANGHRQPVVFVKAIDTRNDPTQKIPLVSDLKNLVANMTYAQYCEYAGKEPQEDVDPGHAKLSGTALATHRETGCTNTDETSESTLLGGGYKIQKAVVGGAYPIQTNRTFTGFNGVAGFENCYTIASDVVLTNGGSNTPQWVAAAYGGAKLDTNSGWVKNDDFCTTGVFDFTGFGDVPWWEFTVNAPCEVIITGCLPHFANEENGWVISTLSEVPYSAKKSNALAVSKTYASRSFNKGDVVQLCNDNNGDTSFAYGEVPYVTFIKFK